MLSRMPPDTGSAPPDRPVPAPRATTGTSFAAHRRRVSCTCSTVSGITTASGRLRYADRPSHSYGRSSSMEESTHWAGSWLRSCPMMRVSGMEILLTSMEPCCPCKQGRFVLLVKDPQYAPIPPLILQTTGHVYRQFFCTSCYDPAMKCALRQVDMYTIPPRDFAGLMSL